MWTPGGMELGIILVIVLIIFGPGKLPSVGKSLGNAISEFKTGVKGKKDEDESPNPNYNKETETTETK